MKLVKIANVTNLRKESSNEVKKIDLSGMHILPPNELCFGSLSFYGYDQRIVLIQELFRLYGYEFTDMGEIMIDSMADYDEIVELAQMFARYSIEDLETLVDGESCY